MCCCATNSPSGAGTGFPDVCKTVVGPAVVPIPYPNEVDFSDADPGLLADTVLVSGFPAATMATIIMLSQGDDTGELGGLVSEEVMGPAMPLLGSTSVLMEGIPAAYMGSMLGMNGTPVLNCPGVHDTPCQVTVLVAP
jgi:uncharacterized Zn-binding protein involved in type VI secretion